jgi:hypothetical protein
MYAVAAKDTHGRGRAKGLKYSKPGGFTVLL